MWLLIAQQAPVDTASRAMAYIFGNRSGGRDGFVMRSMIVTFYTFGVKTTVVMC